jgi:hypothetical protein
MTTSNAAALPVSPGTAGPTNVLERRFEPRRPACCDLWMIDHHGSTILRCRCTEVSRNGMRLSVPLGYGVAEGQRYELRSHLPGAPPRTSLGLIGSRWATVVRTQVALEANEHHLDVGVVLDHTDALVPRVVS